MRTPPRRALSIAALTAIAASVALGAPPASKPALVAGGCTPGSDWPAARTDIQDAVLALVNAHRAAIGERSLAVSPALSAAAVWKARHMAMYRYMAHDDPAPPVARTIAARLAACGYSGAGWGENIALGYSTAAGVLQAWLASSDHRVNIEDRTYVATGIGAAVAANGTVYWAETFGTSAAGTPPAPPAVSPVTTTTTTATPSAAVTTAPAQVALAPSPDRGAPEAGRPFVLRFLVVAPPTVTGAWGVSCHAHIGRVVAAAFAGGYARCTLVAPQGSSGRRIWGTISVTQPGFVARRWFSRIVR